ncbi:MAG: hypothetical protein IPH69_15295 [Bacteroidales bacterium]|nr:hypothetical protein [Bacteroidales bacterium]
MQNLTLFDEFKTYIRKDVLFFSAVVIVAALFNQKLFSQVIIENQGVTYKERLILNTDRSLYITGEKVWLKVTTLNSLTNTPSDNSKVVYVEFLDRNNFPLRQLKVRVENHSGSSVFSIPENLLSGNYVIRAYSNWMQNWPADQFCHKTISVVNPFGSFESLALQSPSSLNGPVKEVSGEGNTIVKPGSEDAGEILFKITPDKSEYSTREKVKLVIAATDVSGNPIESDLSVSVAKTGIVNSEEMQKSGLDNLQSSTSMVPESKDPKYLPELEGHLIYGIIRLKETGEPLRNSGISLSYVGKIARCQFSSTNNLGEFYFVVREPGTNEIVIQPINPDITGYYIDIRQPFNSNFSNYQPSLFRIDSTSIDKINNAVISMQINNLYEPFRQKMPATPKKAIPDFYGKPENTILMADYIELSTIREVVKEIIPNVYTLKQNGKLELKLINKLQSLPFENKPLVLVDGVPMYDFEKVLVINSKEIERADVLNKRYFFSEYIFDGILSFVTKKGNLSAMDFDNTIFRQVYEGCLPKEEFYSPEYSTDSLKSGRIPDYRNTLYWSSDKSTDKDGKTFVEFYTSDETTDYTIVVRGISADGKSGFSTASLKVKQVPY